MAEEPSRLETIAAKASATVLGAEIIFCYNNFDGLHYSGLDNSERFRWLPIENSYFGDMPEIATAVFASGWVAHRVARYAQRTGNAFLEKASNFVPAAASAAIAAYYVLGESVLPQLLPGTADVRDIPAVLLTAIAAPVVTHYVRKKWEAGWEQRAQELIAQVNRSHEQRSAA